MKPDTRYQRIYRTRKSQMQKGIHDVGNYLQSEPDLCRTFSVTGTAVGMQKFIQWEINNFIKIK